MYLQLFRVILFNINKYTFIPKFCFFYLISLPFQILHARDTFTMMCKCVTTYEVRTCYTQVSERIEKSDAEKILIFITRLVKILTYFHERRYLTSNECTLNKVWDICAELITIPRTCTLTALGLKKRQLSCTQCVLLKEVPFP